MPFDNTSTPEPDLPPRRVPTPKGMWSKRDAGCIKACCMDSFVGRGEVCDECGLREDGTNV